ncbi:MAG: hypothetical protein V4819_08900 [Verrucomicrobiota bacterium]
MSLVARPCSAALACFVCLMLSLADAGAAAKTFRYFRFVTTHPRDNPAAASSIQISEFQFIRNGAILGTVGVTVANPGGNSPVGEGTGNLLDSNLTTKWLDFNKRELLFTFPAPVTIDAYTFATANDAPERDPSNWKFLGSADGIAWTLLDDIDGYAATDLRGTLQPRFYLPASVPPYSSFWHPAYLETWTPASDPNAAFNRSNVPLTARFAPVTSASPLNVNSHARPAEAKIATLSGFPTSGNPSQSTLTEHTNAMSFWQYTEDCVYFGGSAGEGLILAPSAPVIDAAHRNGVPVFGNVFFPPTAFGGRFAWVNDFLKKTGSTFPVADKMIEVANYYGFDGWFINQETSGGNAATATAMKDFILYLRAQAPNLKIMWYDAMNESGGVGWQDRFNTQNDLFMKDGANPVSHSMFIDFGWSQSGIAASRAHALSLGLSPYALYAGVEFDMNSFNQPFDWTTLFPEGSPHEVSVGFYGLGRNFQNSGNPTQFHANESRFWSGPNGDPTNTVTADTWKGMAHYVPASSPLTTLPFVTNFNLGHGHLYAINGQVRMTREWSNLSVQDVLPTWRWIVQSSDANKLVPSLDQSTAYYGGTNLRIAGTLDGTDDIKLFQSSLPVAADSSLRVVFNRETTGASAMQIGLAFEDSPTVFQYLDVGNAATTSWNTKVFSLSAYAGREIAMISLRFTSTGTISNYTMRVGQLAIYNGSITAPAAPSGLVISQQDSLDVDSLALRLKWNHSASPVYYYNIYSRAPNNSLVWLGATPNNAFFVPAAVRLNSQATMPIEVEAVGRNFASSPLIAATATFPALPTTSLQLTGTIIGSPGAWNNGTVDTKEKVFDGNLSTAYDALNATGDWAGLDLGSGNNRVVTAIRFCPRGGFVARMVGGIFQGSNTADFSGNPVTLATVALVPATGVFTTVAVDQATVFRYVRYIGPPGSHCNVSEIQFFGVPLPAAPTGLTGRMVEGTVNLTWNATAYAKTYSVKRATAIGGPYTPVETLRVPPNYTGTGLSLGATYHYVISAVNEAGEGPNSAPFSVADAYYAWAQQNGIVPGAAGSGFDEDADGDGLQNGVEYVVPTGTSIVTGASGATISAVVRIDAAITTTLQGSTDLALWNPLTFTVAADQSNVPPGFQRMSRLDPPVGGVTRKYFRLRFIR